MNEKVLNSGTCNEKSNFPYVHHDTHGVVEWW